MRIGRVSIPVILTIILLILIAVITAKTLENKENVSDKQNIETTNEHNWQRNEENLYCDHCKKILKIGDWIAYKPKPKEEAIKITNEESGISEYEGKENTLGQEFYQEQHTYWRIIGVQDKDGNGSNETLLIKMASSTEYYLQLYGITGYNNGPEIMNRICRELYSNDKYGKARSITMEDVENTLECKHNGGLYGIREGENVEINEFKGKLKEMPIWDEIVNTGKFYTPDGTNTEERLGEYDLNGYGYEIIKLEEESIRLASPAINASEDIKQIKTSIGETIWANQYGHGDNYLLATQGVIAEPDIVAFGLGSVSSNNYVRSFCDVYFSTGESEEVIGRLCPVVELKNEIPKVIQAPEEYEPEHWYDFE